MLWKSEFEFNSLSKTYNLTGLRLSFLIGNREIVSKFKTVRSQFDYGTSFIYQKAAVAALNGPQGYVADNRAEYELRRNALVAGIKKLGLKPADVKGTMFVWAAIPDGYTNSADYVMELLNKTGVFMYTRKQLRKPWRRSCKTCPCTSS